MSAEASWPREQLVVAAQGGDPNAIAALVSGSHPHVQRFARTLCASPEDAEDSAQEALIILYRKIGTLRASGVLVSWMFRSVRNECLRRGPPGVAWRGPTASRNDGLGGGRRHTTTTCPVRNRHVRDLAGRATDLAAANVRVLVAVPEGWAQAAAWKAKHEMPFPVVTGHAAHRTKPSG